MQLTNVTPRGETWLFTPRGETWLSRNGRPKAGPESEHPAVAIWRHPDPFAALASIMGAPDNEHRVLLGVTSSGLNLSAPRLNVAWMGPPRIDKTSTAVGALCAHRGFVAGFSTKRVELAGAIGQSRARVAGTEGQLLHLGLDGSRAPSGWTSAGWTPISKDPWRASIVAKAMTDAIEMSKGAGVKSGGFWATLAARTLKALLLGAGLGDKPMEWLLHVVNTQDSDMIEESVDLLMAADREGARQGADTLSGLDRFAPETRGGIWATVAAALAVYETEEALAVCRRPPLDFDALVRGHPDVPNIHLRLSGGPAPLGCYSTLLVTAPTQALSLMAPQFVAVGAELQRATFALHEEDQEAGRE